MGGSDQYVFGGKRGIRFDADPGYGAEYRAINRYLDIYGESSPNVEIFHCPNDTKPNSAIRQDITTFDYDGTSYQANDLILGFGSGSPRPLSTITRPHSRIYLELDIPYNEPGHGGKGISGWPRIPVMVLFVDGHVAGPFLWDEDFEFGVGNDIKVFKHPDGSY